MPLCVSQKQRLFVLLPTQVVAYNEARIMRKLEGVPGMCRLLDYGMDKDHSYLVMPKYKGSLRQWRLEQPNITSRVSLELFLQAVSLVKVGAATCASAYCMTLLETTIDIFFECTTISLLPQISRGTLAPCLSLKNGIMRTNVSSLRRILIAHYHLVVEQCFSGCANTFLHINLPATIVCADNRHMAMGGSL